MPDFGRAGAYNLEIEVGETASGVWPLSFTTGNEHGEKTLAKPGCSVAPGSRLTDTSATTITLAGLAAALFASRRRRR